MLKSSGKKSNFEKDSIMRKPCFALVALFSIVLTGPSFGGHFETLKKSTENTKSLSQDENTGMKTYMQELQALSTMKAKGKLTNDEFEKKKTELKEKYFQSPEEKKKQEEVAKLAADASKAQEIAKEKNRLEQVALAAREYDVKFPLHAAVKAQNTNQLKALLQASTTCDVNAFDDTGKTAYDFAYAIQSATSSFALCNALKNAGGVSSEEIKKFAEGKEKKADSTPSAKAPPSWEYKTVEVSLGMPNRINGVPQTGKSYDDIKNDFGKLGWEITNEEFISGGSYYRNSSVLSMRRLNQ